MYDVRPLTPGELPLVAARLSAEFPRDGFTAPNIDGKVFGDPDFDPALNLGAWRDGRLTSVLLGVRRGETSWIKAANVTADAAAAEVLLAAFETAVRDAGATTAHVSGSAPSYFLPGVDPTDTVTLQFWQRHGYERLRDSFNMACDLLALDTGTEADEARLAAGGYRLARLTAADREALSAFLLAHFSAGWLTETLAGLALDPVPVHVAWHGEAIVAFAAAEVSNPGWFGPMGTGPAHRRAGLGRVLLLRCLADLRQLGWREAQIGWVGPLGFYARHCGARVSRVFWMLRKTLVTRA